METLTTITTLYGKVQLTKLYATMIYNTGQNCSVLQCIRTAAV